MSRIDLNYDGGLGKDVHVTLKDVNEMHITELLYEFQLFLTSIGYSLNGNIEIVQEYDIADEPDIEWDNRPDAPFGSFRIVTPSEE